MTPTATGTNSKDKCDNKKSAQRDTGSRTRALPNANRSRTIPITGPGSGRDNPRESNSPTVCSESSHAKPASADDMVCDDTATRLVLAILKQVPANPKQT